MYIVPAIKDNRQVSKGRGKGGLVSIWSNKITKYVSQIKCENYRLQATRFDFPSGPLLVLNTYFPCDPRTRNFDDTELIKLLTDIQTVVLQSHVQNILLAGDLNCDFSRNTRFTRLVHDYLNESSLKLLWENSDLVDCDVDVDFTFMSTANGTNSISTIDHFACSSRIFNIISEAGVIHSSANTSNHSPIFVKLDIGNLDLKTEKSEVPRHVEWSAATNTAKAEYKAKLAELLSNIPPSACVGCHDVHCKDHTDDMQEYTMSILGAIETAASETLPSRGGSTRSGYRRPTPGWSEFVQPYLEESKFWYSLWTSAGKPSGGALFNAMRDSKNQYKYSVRRLKRAGESIQNDKFVDSVINGGVNIFKEIKKFRGSGTTNSSVIDNEVGSHNIAQHFAGIYSALYSKVQLGPDFEEFYDDINLEVSHQSMAELDRIDDNLIKQALGMMKTNKRDAMFDIQSDCIINGPPELVHHLTNLLKTFIQHGSVPYFVLLCSLLPLVKDSLGDTTSSENYRAIASGSLLLKLLDLVILLLQGNKLECDPLQFGFQAGTGTVMCTWTASAVIDYFNSRGSVVYGCAMDLSKAFDMVNWKELFLILRRRGVDPIFLRVLIFIYRNQKCNVKWNSSYSQHFSVRNGVRQGAVSSPILFSVYINDLLLLLKQAGLGCHVGTFFLGCLGYADDLLLLSASRSGLQAMVNICENFMRKKNLKFSTHPDAAKSKTKCIVFSKKSKDLRNISPIFLNENPLPWVQQVKHLGNILQNDNSMKIDCTIKRGRYIGKVNSLLQEFHFVSPKVKMKLMTIFATSFYGSCLWDLQSSECDRIFKSWNVTVRNVFGVTPTSHKYLVEPLAGTPHARPCWSLGLCSSKRVCTAAIPHTR